MDSHVQYFIKRMAKQFAKIKPRCLILISVVFFLFCFVLNPLKNRQVVYTVNRHRCLSIRMPGRSLSGGSAYICFIHGKQAFHVWSGNSQFPSSGVQGPFQGVLPAPCRLRRAHREHHFPALLSDIASTAGNRPWWEYRNIGNRKPCKSRLLPSPSPFPQMASPPCAVWIVRIVRWFWRFSEIEHVKHMAMRPCFLFK